MVCHSLLQWHILSDLSTTTGTCKTPVNVGTRCVSATKDADQDVRGIEGWAVQGRKQSPLKPEVVREGWLEE